jgi:hypothetical protein
MAVEDNRPAVEAAAHNAYGKIFRERGTTRIVIGALILGLVWYVYSEVRTQMLMSRKWPALQTESQGLTVLGLPRKYVAIEASHAWQIRLRDDVSGEGSDSSDEDEPEAQDRGGGPAAASRVTHGRIVPVEEIMKSCPVVLTGRHFSGAWVEEKSDFSLMIERKYWTVHLDLTDEGRSRYYQYSRNHNKERLVFVLNDQILTCPDVQPMYVSSFGIEPIWVLADATKLADFVKKQKK